MSPHGHDPLALSYTVHLKPVTTHDFLLFTSLLHMVHLGVLGFDRIVDSVMLIMSMLSSKIHIPYEFQGENWVDMTVVENITVEHN